MIFKLRKTSERELDAIGLMQGYLGIILINLLILKGVITL